MDFIDKTIDYLRSSKAELSKVTWPSKQDTIRYSVLVISASIFMAAFFAIMDRGLVSVVQAVIQRRPVAPVSAPAQTQQTVPVTLPAPEIETVPVPTQSPTQK